MIAHDPLHRSGQAALPHPALALGHDVEPLTRPGMVDADVRKPASGIATEAVHRQRVGLAAAPKRPEPGPQHPAAECAQLATVAGHSVVTEVSVDDSAQVFALLGDGVVHAPPQLGSHLAQLRLPAFANRLPHQHVPTAPTASTDVSEPEEVEG